jgi:hypothetical protein
MKAIFIILIEGLRLLWACRDRRKRIPIPSKVYLWWRLGTVYGLQPPGADGYPDGSLPPKAFKDLLRQAWQDRAQVFRHILWRRDMRLLRDSYFKAFPK